MVPPNEKFRVTLSTFHFRRDTSESKLYEYILQAGLTEEKSKVDPPENESQETQTVIINTDTAEEGEVVNEERKHCVVYLNCLALYE